MSVSGGGSTKESCSGCNGQYLLCSNCGTILKAGNYYYTPVNYGSSGGWGAYIYCNCDKFIKSISGYSDSSSVGLGVSQVVLASNCSNKSNCNGTGYVYTPYNCEHELEDAHEYCSHDMIEPHND